MTRNYTGVSIKPRILFVDDNLNFIKSVTSFLKKDKSFELTGYASSGEDAMQRIKSGPPDIIFLDLNMPVMNGLQTASLIKNLNPSIKIIIMSLHQEDEYASMAKAAGADGFIVKSRFVEEFQKLLSSILVPGVTDLSDP